MKFFMILSKRNLIIITSLLVIGFIVWGSVVTAKGSLIEGGTNAQRIAFIERLGYSVDDSLQKSKNINLPTEFSDVYIKYNQLQKKAGFDLTHHKGKSAQIFTYPLSGDDSKELHLIVCDGIIIGGDVAEIRFDGEMKPLAKAFK